MTERANLDAAALRSWIGRSETANDLITPRLVKELKATLGQAADTPKEGPKEGEVAPLAIHWCITPDVVPMAELGPDGHPTRGGFLPPVALPRRMWAGGALRFHDRLHVGDVVERRSHITDIKMKQGRSGELCFVSVEHEIATVRGIAISERQDIVYREQSSGRVKIIVPESRWQAEVRREMQADPVLLFRYSALTFNGHRIHYDRRYATGIENYPGLIVHGPLQATLLIELAATTIGRAPKSFNFRSVTPLFDFAPFALCARHDEDALILWIEMENGVRTMEARATW